ncbi:RND efflux system, inner membrane transporter [hydrothermal vent metagenome]|uniref:RND efflux system, inner membrane transporter n=1 Tax=hydrothermal vent metagenome TaxID=652676 RepID=A0A3B0RB45_9ZZZZ
MNMQNISAWSIRNPVVPLVIFIGLLFAGVLSFSRMEVNDNPDIDFPAARIVISQPGAAPSEVESQITQLVDSALQSINGVSNISSTASEGQSRTFVEFDIGTDTDQAVNDVKNAIDTIRGDLPDGILEPRISRVDIGGNTLAYFSVKATDMTIEQLSWFVDDTVTKRLLGVEGMASVFRGGGVDREIRVVVYPEKMQALGITASQINGALRQVNTDVGGGQAEIGGSRQSVRVLGNADSAYELSQTQISLGDGRSIKLKDVAAVSDGYGEQRSINKIGDKQVVTFGFQRAKGASDVTVYDSAMEVLDVIKKENPGIEFKRSFSGIDYTKSQYRSSIAAMVEGALLAVVVVFLFLRDWRATVISAIAIPLSAIPAFWFMDLMGFTLNTMSLLALGLVAGVLVDDAIVEIENIVRHMRMGKSAYQASIDAADEIGLAVVATTFSIVAVFLPVGLMPGISGQFFMNFGLTVVVAVLMSLAVARMISPMIAAYFMKAKGEAQHASGPLMDRYIEMLKWSLHNRWKMVMVGVAAFAVTISLFFVIPGQFFPDQNIDFSIAKIEMVPGTTLKKTEQVTGRVAAILDEQPEVDVALQDIDEGSANIYISLLSERTRSSMDFERDLAEQFKGIADARVTFQNLNGPGGGGSGRALSIMLSGSDPELLDQTAATLIEQMKNLPGVVAPRINADMRRPEIIIKPRLDLAAQLGVTTVALSQAIRIATLGEIDQNSAKFSLSSRQIPIRVMLPEDSRKNISTIENLPVPTARGGSVPLSRVAEISFGSGPTTIQRYNQSRRVLIGADLSKGVLKGDVDKLINEKTIMKDLPPGVSNTQVGSDEVQQEMLTNFPIAVVSGILLVFGVLVLLYKRFMAPLVNMSSLLIAPLGGLLLIWATGQPLSMPVFIGTLMLIGIVGKNSILLIDFALLEIDRGVPKYEALVNAGRKRAQPIVMTTVAMVAGMVPTAISLSGDGAWRAPMGIVVIGGLIVSTIMTLALVPAGFSLADDVEKWMGRFFGKYLLADPTVGRTDPEPEVQPAE